MDIHFLDAEFNYESGKSLKKDFGHNKKGINKFFILLKHKTST